MPEDHVKGVPIIQTLQCNSCKGIYETITSDGSPYYHACADVLVDGVHVPHPNKRNEARVYTEDNGMQAVSEGAGVTWIKDGTQGTTPVVLHSEGAGSTMLHEGRREPNEVAPARPMHASKKPKAKGSVRKRKKAAKRAK